MVASQTPQSRRPRQQSTPSSAHSLLFSMQESPAASRPRACLNDSATASAVSGPSACVSVPDTASTKPARSMSEPFLSPHQPIARKTIHAPASTTPLVNSGSGSTALATTLWARPTSSPKAPAGAGSTLDVRSRSVSLPPRRSLQCSVARTTQPEDAQAHSAAGGASGAAVRAASLTRSAAGRGLGAPTRARSRPHHDTRLGGR